MQIKLPYPHQGQQAVRTEARRFNWLAAGRRWRKTTLGVSIGVEAAAAGQELLWGAPTFDQVRIGWNEMKHAASGVAKFTQQTMTAEYPSGGKVIFRSLDDPDNARGHTADGVIIDEASKVKAEAWYEVLRAMLIDTGGWGWFMFTPLGRNWTFIEHAAARSRDDSVCWQIPVVGCEVVDNGRRLERRPHPYENPDIPFEEIEAMFATLPVRTFRQEILAEFVEGEGAVFRNIRANLYNTPGAPADHEGHELVMGADWGKHLDYTALSVLCSTCNQEVALDRFNQIDYAFQRGRLRVLFERWRPYNVVAEANAMGDPIIEMLRREGIPVTSFQTTATSKPPLIESLALALEKEEVKWLDDPIATAELEAYERDVSATTGRPRYGAPAGVHDDTVMARALANHGRAASGPWAVLL